MKQVKRWRYYCDHCKKSGCQKHAIAKHESSCIRNDARVCRMCKFMGLEQRPMAELVEAASSGLKPLEEAAENCPVCILSAIVRARPIPKTPDEPWDDRFDAFEFKKEMNEVFQNAADAREEYC
ncbi:MAG: hypothetical protein KGQ57_22295 [Burkholderiales bacterium]|nr:hypothetical protein [Burkholderiales bacterium]